MSGFLSGIFWGTVVGGGALLISGLTLDRQQLSFPKPETGAVEVPGGSEFNQARPESEPVLPTTEGRPEADVVASVEAPEDAIDAPPTLDTAALEVPEPTLDAPGGLGDAPEVPSETQPEIATDTAPTGGQSGVLSEPESPGTAPTTEVADPASPAGEVSEEETSGMASAGADVATDAGETEIAALPEATTETVQPETGSAPAVSPQAEAPEVPSQPEIAEEAALPDAGSDADTGPEIDTGPDIETGVGDSPEAPRLPQITEEPSLPTGDTAPEVADETPVVPEAPATAGTDGAETIRVDGGPSVLEPVDDLTNRAEGVETSRLPQAGVSSLPGIRRIGVVDADEAEVEAEVTEETVEAEEAVEPGGPALVAFASAFENPQGHPLLSVVLVHSSEAPLSAEMLDGLPRHVSFAIDAGDPAAADLARTYRAAGREIVMIPSLPEGAAPQDVEQALRVNFDTIPEAVAVMDVSGSSFQSDRQAVQQVVDVVAASGHGVITFPRGLNTAHQQAQKEGVPTGLIFRNIDGANETAEKIQRTLDRAAFRARQNEGVILVGTTDPVTLAALVGWTLGNRAESVTIAPVSAALASGG